MAHFGGNKLWRSPRYSSLQPPRRQPMGKSIVSSVNSHTNATRIGCHLWEVDLRFAPGLPPGWVSGAGRDLVSIGHVIPNNGSRGFRNGSNPRSSSRPASKRSLDRCPLESAHLREGLSITRPACPRTKTPGGGLEATRAWGSLKHCPLL